MEDADGLDYAGDPHVAKTSNDGFINRANKMLIYLNFLFAYRMKPDFGKKKSLQFLTPEIKVVCWL